MRNVKATQTDIEKTEQKATIKFNDTKVGSSVFYNLIELKIVESPDENDVWYPYFFAEKIYNDGFNRMYLQIDTKTTDISLTYFRKKNGEWVRNTSYYYSSCKLR